MYNCRWNSKVEVLCRLPRCERCDAFPTLCSSDLNRDLGFSGWMHHVYHAGLVCITEDGTPKWRFCVDFRGVNEVTVRDVYPLSNITETLDSLSGCTMFTTLDWYV